MTGPLAKGRLFFKVRIRDRTAVDLKDPIQEQTSPKRPLRLAFSILLLCIAGQLLYELTCTGTEVNHRVDRWMSLSGPFSRPLLRLSVSASNETVRELARKGLSRQPYPYSLDWLLEELASNPFAPCELTEQDWVRYGLSNRGVQARVLSAALAADFSEGRFSRNFLLQFCSRFKADSWVWPEVLRACESQTALRALLPYQVQHGQSPMGSKAFRSIVAATERSVEPDFGALEPEEQENLLFWLSEHDRDLLLNYYFKGRGRLKAIAGVLLLSQGESAPRPWLRHIADQELPTLSSYRLEDELLAELATQLPETRFARGCSAYQRIQGQECFAPGADSEPAKNVELRRTMLSTAEQSETRWRDWLQRYPGHPATGLVVYQLSRTLEWQGKRKQAFALVLRQLHAAKSPAQPRLAYRFFWMLDVGLTAGEISEFERLHQHSPVGALLRYALAVRAARQHRYQRALNLTQELTLDRSYLAMLGVPWPGSEADRSQRTLDDGLTDQRARWQGMLGQNRRFWAERWSEEEGWRLGALYLYPGERESFLQRGNDYIDSLAIEPSGRPDAALIRRHYQQASPAGASLSLLGKLAQSPEILLWRIQLLQRLKLGNPHEAQAVVPLPGYPRAPRESWYGSQIEYLTRCLEQRYPGDERCDDALMSCYRVSGDPSFLREIRLFYPASDQARNLPATGTE